jgi:hypothetical protein
MLSGINWFPENNANKFFNQHQVFSRFPVIIGHAGLSNSLPAKISTYKSNNYFPHSKTSVLIFFK